MSLFASDDPSKIATEIKSHFKEATDSVRIFNQTVVFDFLERKEIKKTCVKYRL
jgi:hypothetical protein